MMTQNHKSMIVLAQKYDESAGVDQTNPRAYIPKAVLASVENGLVSPSMLLAELKKVDHLNGDIVNNTGIPSSTPGQPGSLDASEFTLWVPIPPDTEKGETEPTKHVLAFGHSQTWQDALLHAILGYLRECEKGQR